MECQWASHTINFKMDSNLEFHCVQCGLSTWHSGTSTCYREREKERERERERERLGLGFLLENNCSVPSRPAKLISLEQRESRLDLSFWIMQQFTQLTRHRVRSTGCTDFCTS